MQTMWTKSCMVMVIQCYSQRNVEDDKPVASILAFSGASRIVTVQSFQFLLGIGHQCRTRPSAREAETRVTSNLRAIFSIASYQAAGLFRITKS